MTHCYRVEDRKVAQEGLFNEPEGTLDLSIPTEFVLTFPSSPFMLKPSKDFYQR